MTSPGIIEFKKIEDIIEPLYNNAITKFEKLNNRPHIYLIEFIPTLLGCEKREDGYWYGVTGKEKKTREIIKNTLEDMEYEIIFTLNYGSKLDYDFGDRELHIIKEIN